MADVFQGSAPTDRAADGAAIRELLRRQQNGWDSVALIHADAAVTKRGRQSRRPSRINTSVAVRTADGWMLAASQNTTRRRLAETLLQKLASRDNN